MRRRTFLWSAAALALFACSGGADGGPEARRWVADGATLLDVRSPGEWAGGHLEGATHIPVQELSARMHEVPAGRVVVYCQSGVRSAMAARTLEAEGYEVYDLGSMSAWGSP